MLQLDALFKTKHGGGGVPHVVPLPQVSRETNSEAQQAASDDGKDGKDGKEGIHVDEHVGEGGGGGDAGEDGGGDGGGDGVVLPVASGGAAGRGRGGGVVGAMGAMGAMGAVGAISVSMSRKMQQRHVKEAIEELDAVHSLLLAQLS